MKTMTILVLALVGVICSGCVSMESAAKMILDASWEAAEKIAAEKMPLLEGKIMAGMKERLDEGFEKVSGFVATKTAESADKVLDRVYASTGVDVSTWDKDGDGLSISEIVAGRREENEKREKRGEAPLGLSEQFWLLIAIGVLTAGKSARRVLLKHMGKTNGEAGDPPAVNPNK